MLFGPIPLEQLAPLKTVTLSQVRNRWLGLALLPNQLERLLKKGEFKEKVLDWMDFFAFACFTIAEVLNIIFFPKNQTYLWKKFFI